jgi:hypothetical protein
MSTPIDNERNPPAAEPAQLPALPATSDSFLLKVKIILDSMLGRTGSQYDRVVTWRDLWNLGFSFNGGNVGVGIGIDQGQTSSAGQLPAHILDELARQFERELRNSPSYKLLTTKIGTLEDLAAYPEELRQLVASNILEVARQRQADIVSTESRLQSLETSMASRMVELTSSIGEASAGLREVDFTYSTRTLALSKKITTVSARLDSAGGEGVTLEQQLSAQATTNGQLLGQYTLRINAGGKISGFGLASTETSSEFVILADKFGIFTNSGDVMPFGVDGTGVYMNTNVRINGSALINGTVAIKDVSGNTILSAGTPLDWTKIGALTDITNLFPDILFTSTAWPASSTNFTVSTAPTGTIPATKVLRFNDIAITAPSNTSEVARYTMPTAMRVQVTPGEKLYVSYYLQSKATATGTANMGLRFVDAAGAFISDSIGPGAIALPVASPTKYAWSSTVPANAAQAFIIYFRRATAVSTEASGWVEYGLCRVSRTEDGATVGADWATNVTGIPYDTVYNNDDSVALGYNPTFSAWAGTFPDGWIDYSSSSALIAKETVIKRTGLYSVKFTVGAADDAGMSREVTWTASPMPVGTFIAGSFDAYISSIVGTGVPGIRVQFFTSADLTTSNSTNVILPSTATGTWQRVPFTARVPAGIRIYGMRIYVMASYSGFSAGRFQGTVIFDNLRFAFFDSSVDTTTISLNNDGTLNGGGGGQVTITGLGYAGSLNAGVNAPGLGIKLNYSAFSTANSGEVYLHGFDIDGNAANVDGYVMYDGVRITVPRAYLDPNVAGSFYILLDKAGRNLWNSRSTALAQKNNGVWTWRFAGTTGTVTIDSDILVIGSVVSAGTESISHGAVWTEALLPGVVPETNATVGATFGDSSGAGSNISGQITTGNVSTYIAAGAIGNAYIGNFIQSTNFNGTIDASGAITANGTTGWAISKSGTFVCHSITARGSISGGAISSWAWPAAGSSGFYLGPNGLLIGNFNDGKWFRAAVDGTLSMPGLSVADGVLTISQANVINTLNVGSNQITVPSSITSTTNTANFTLNTWVTVLTLTVDFGTVSPPYVHVNALANLLPTGAGGNTTMQLRFLLDGTTPGGFTSSISVANGFGVALPHSDTFQNPGTGTHTFQLQINNGNGTTYYGAGRTMSLIGAKR